jgi:hypothetical protein
MHPIHFAQSAICNLQGVLQRQEKERRHGFIYRNPEHEIGVGVPHHGETRDLCPPITATHGWGGSES